MSNYLLVLGLCASFTAGISGCKSAAAPTPAPAVAAQSGPVSKNVTFKGVGGFDLVGTYLVPVAAKGCQAMLLIPGSGPTDRDGNQAGLKVDLLKDIAEKLASKGIATLRFDKRAVASVYMAKYPKSLAEMNDFFSWEAFSGDATAAFKYLQAQPEVDPKKVGILGHSEGGLIALDISQAVHPDALVLGSTAGRDLGTVIIEQVHQGFSAQFSDGAKTKKLTDETTKTVNAIRTSGNVPTGLSPEIAPIFPSYASKYLRSIFTLDPAKLAVLYQGPALVVQGDKDIQVSPTADAPVLMGALPKGAELYVVANGTHVWRQWVSKTDPGFSGKPITAAFDKVAEWCSANLK